MLCKDYVLHNFYVKTAEKEFIKTCQEDYNERDAIRRAVPVTLIFIKLTKRIHCLLSLHLCSDDK